jgi:hypothetical protein
VLHFVTIRANPRRFEYLHTYFLFLQEQINGKQQQSGWSCRSWPTPQTTRFFLPPPKTPIPVPLRPNSALQCIPGPASHKTHSKV